MAGKPKYERPPRRELIELVQQEGQHGAAKHYGVSRGAVQNWLNQYEVPGKQRRMPRPSAAEQVLGLEDEPREPTAVEEDLARQLLAAESSRQKQTAKLTAARSTIRELELEREKLERMLEVVALAERHPRPGWLGGAKKSKGHRGILVAAYSDFHIGEAVDPAEMNGYNAYNVEIAEQRTRRFFERTILVARDYLAGVKYDGIVVPHLGDTISGDIHEEFKQTNELSNYEAIPHAVAWLEEGIGLLADEFGKVHVPCVPGNHPRDSKAPRYKRRSAHNADTLISNLVAQKFRSDDRVTFDVPAALSADFKVYETKFRIEHGDEAKGGSGIQGALAPLALHTHRRRKQAQAEGTPFDVLMLGHWHQLMFALGKGFIVNGSGKGYDEYARGKAFEPEAPQQALLVVTPEHGVTAQLPLFVGKRSSEGW